jgi:hypothetical protein
VIGLNKAGGKLRLLVSIVFVFTICNREKQFEHKAPHSMQTH